MGGWWWNETFRGVAALVLIAWTAHEAVQPIIKVTRTQERRLNDGTTFEIYKRYLSPDDVERWIGKYGLTTRIEHLGPALFAVSGSFITT